MFERIGTDHASYKKGFQKLFPFLRHEIKKKKHPLFIDPSILPEHRSISIVLRRILSG